MDRNLSAPAPPIPAAARSWTIERQAGFIRALYLTGCVGRAAAAVGMSREGAYRLRKRDGAFAAAWAIAAGALARVRRAAPRPAAARRPYRMARVTNWVTAEPAGTALP